MQLEVFQESKIVDSHFFRAGKPTMNTGAKTLCYSECGLF
jgi:hypothetical protein